MTFLCDMWKISAEEYMAFLTRHGIKCLGIHIIFRDRTVIFVDESKYLDISLNDKKFSEAEKQIIKLLERSEKLVDKFTELAVKTQSKEEKTDDEFEDQFQEEFEETLQQYDEEE